MPTLLSSLGLAVKVLLGARESGDAGEDQAVERTLCAVWAIWFPCGCTPEALPAPLCALINEPVGLALDEALGPGGYGWTCRAATGAV